MVSEEVPAPNQRVEYSEDVVDRILDELKAGETLRAICKKDWAPTRSTFHDWEKQNKNGLSDRYARARQIGWEEMADELLEIADDGSNDWMIKETERGDVEVLDHEHIQRSRLRIDTRKWILSKRVPEFGDKLQVETNPSEEIAGILKAVADKLPN
jgi:hypothetical protein